MSMASEVLAKAAGEIHAEFMHQGIQELQRERGDLKAFMRSAVTRLQVALVLSERDVSLLLKIVDLVTEEGTSSNSKVSGVRGVWEALLENPHHPVTRAVVGIALESTQSLAPYPTAASPRQTSLGRYRERAWASGLDRRWDRVVQHGAESWERSAAGV